MVKPVPYVRHKIFAREEVERFVKGQAGGWKDSPKKRRPPTAMGGSEA